MRHRTTTTAPVHTTRLPDSGFQAEFFLRPFQGRLDLFVEWSPRVPRFNKLSAKDMNAYRQASFQATLSHPAAQGPGSVARVEL